MSRSAYVLSREVKAALRARQAVVALETSVVAQGLPSPHNLELARQCEEVIRGEGAIPAAVAALDGKLYVGLSNAQLERLADKSSSLWKVASRDLPAVVAGGHSGGTTVSATMEVASAVGIRVFATGGVGGVHRGAEGDISQDLWALSRFPVAVVCAGAKSVLDLPRTLEALESLAVPVVGVDTDDFPGFYTRTTGLPLEHRVSSAEEGARWMEARFTLLSQGGMVFALPPPEQTSLPAAQVARHIDESLRLAARKKVRGKAVTPFLLGELVRRTGGASLEANLALLKHNARFAARLAIGYARRRGR